MMNLEMNVMNMIMNENITAGAAAPGDAPADVTALELDFETVLQQMMVMAAGAGRRLSHDRLAGLRVMARMVFAETALELGILARSCSDPGAPEPEAYAFDGSQSLAMNLTLGCAATALGKLPAVKRLLEHAVAAGTLAWFVAGDDADATRLLQQRRADTLARIRETLDGFPGAVAAGWP